MQLRKRVMILAAVLLLLFSGGMGIASKIVSDRKQEAVEAVHLAEEEKRRSKEQAEAEVEKTARAERETVYGFGLESGGSVFEAVRNRPPMVELTEENTADFVTIDSCRINTQINKITVSASAEGLPASDDRFYYLFALKPYEK